MAKTYSLGGIGLPIKTQHQLIRRIWLKIVKKECFWLQEQWRMTTLLTGSELFEQFFWDTIWVNGMDFSSKKFGLTQVTPKNTMGIFPRKCAAYRDYNFMFKASSACRSRTGFFWKWNFYKILHIISYYFTNFQRNIAHTFSVIDDESLFAT